MNKICRICLEEGVLSSIFTRNYNISLSDMVEYCCNLKCCSCRAVAQFSGQGPQVQVIQCDVSLGPDILIVKDDGLPEFICSNCIYKLGIAYHFKQTSESADIRLRQYLSLPVKSKSNDAAVMTDPFPLTVTVLKRCKCIADRKKRSNYKPKSEEEKQKRGPKPKPPAVHRCFQCNKEFRCQAQLNMHLRTHTGQKPFACPYCERSFAQKHNLTVHLRLHTGDKPYQCEICSKRFTAQGNLQTHIKIHTGQKDHECSVCHKAFVTSSELTRHTHKHSGTKNYKCDVCATAFVQQRDLKLHKLKKHQLDIRKPEDKEPLNRNDIDIINLDVDKEIPDLTIKPNLLVTLTRPTLPDFKPNTDLNTLYEKSEFKHQDALQVHFDSMVGRNLKETPLYGYGVEKHVCTFCGEQFDFVTELAQHCLNSHKGYDPMPPMRSYNLSGS